MTALKYWDGSAWVTVGASQGPIGPQGIQGPTGATGATGPGVPVGGIYPQILRKNSGTNYDASWTYLYDYIQVFGVMYDPPSIAAHSSGGTIGLGTGGVCAVGDWVMFMGCNPRIVGMLMVTVQAAITVHDTVYINIYNSDTVAQNDGNRAYYFLRVRQY